MKENAHLRILNDKSVKAKKEVIILKWITRISEKKRDLYAIWTE